jgi:hypothetical protein
MGGRFGRPVPILLTGGWLVAGGLQPAAYSSVRETVSVVAGHAGTDQWVMTGALFLVGGCHLVTAAGLAGVPVPARVLLLGAGAGLLRNRRIPPSPWLARLRSTWPGPRSAP